VSAGRKYVFMVTHDVDEAILMSDRIALMTPARGAPGEIVDVKIPRPRVRAALIEDPAYLRLRAHILSFLIEGARPRRSSRRHSNQKSKEENMDRAAALEKIRGARAARGVTYEELGTAIGTKDPTYIAAALHGQHRLNADEAKKLAAAVGVDVDTRWRPPRCRSAPTSR